MPLEFSIFFLHTLWKYSKYGSYICISVQLVTERVFNFYYVVQKCFFFQ